MNEKASEWRSKQNRIVFEQNWMKNKPNWKKERGGWKRIQEWSKLGILEWEETVLELQRTPQLDLKTRKKTVY